GRASTFDHEENLLVHVFFGVERAGGRHLDHIAAPLAFGAMQLDVMTAPALALPRMQGQVLHLADAQVTIYRYAFFFHEGVVGSGLLLELPEPRLFMARRLVPMRPVLVVRHLVPPCA